METLGDLKQRIHDFIDQADERILKIFGGIISAEIKEGKTPTIPDAFYEELDKRRERHLKDESQSYTWEEVKTRAKAAAK